MSGPRRRQMMNQNAGYQNYPQGYAAPLSPNFASQPVGQPFDMQGYGPQYQQAMMLDLAAQGMHPSSAYYQHLPPQQQQYNPSSYVAGHSPFQQQPYCQEQAGSHSSMVRPVSQPHLLRPSGYSTSSHSQSPAAASSSIGASGTPPTGNFADTSRELSPRPSSSATGLQPPQSSQDADAPHGDAREVASTNDSSKDEVRPQTEGEDLHPGTTSLPVKPSFSAGMQAPFLLGVDLPAALGDMPLNPTTVYNAQAPAFVMPRGANATLRRPELLPPGSTGGLAQAELPGIFKSDIAVRFPVLPQLPPMPSEPAASGDGDELQAYKDYSALLKSIIDVYEKRDALLRLRTEAVGFDPARAWKAWEANKEEDDEAVKQDDATDRHPILGVRLLQRVAKLSLENEELGRMLEAKLDLNDSTKEREEMAKELNDSQALIAAMDDALSKAEARASSAEKALRLACSNNSTAIVPTSGSSARGGRGKRGPTQGENDKASMPAKPVESRQPQGASRRGRGGRTQ